MKKKQLRLVLFVWLYKCVDCVEETVSDRHRADGWGVVVVWVRSPLRSGRLHRVELELRNVTSHHDTHGGGGLLPQSFLISSVPSVCFSLKGVRRRGAQLP